MARGGAAALFLVPRFASLGAMVGGKMGFGAEKGALGAAPSLGVRVRGLRFVAVRYVTGGSASTASFVVSTLRRGAALGLGVSSGTGSRVASVSLGRMAVNNWMRLSKATT